jgi:hypothetical protein
MDGGWDVGCERRPPSVVGCERQVSGAPCKPSAKQGKAAPFLPFLYPITCRNSIVSAGSVLFSVTIETALDDPQDQSIHCHHSPAKGNDIGRTGISIDGCDALTKTQPSSSEASTSSCNDMLSRVVPCLVQRQASISSPRGMGGIQPCDTSFDASNRGVMLINHHHSAQVCSNQEPYQTNRFHNQHETLSACKATPEMTQKPMMRRFTSQKEFELHRLFQPNRRWQPSWLAPHAISLTPFLPNV